jgi:hypothetical protein
MDCVSSELEKCGTCYGEGRLPTDRGMAECPDCGGAGTLPPKQTLIEWRLSQIENVHGARGDETSNDVRWLAFELRRARAALTELLTLSEDLDDKVAGTRLRFVANRALELYEIRSVEEKGAPKV